MSGALVLLPSPRDRLDPAAAALRWWTTRLQDVFAPRGSATVSAEDLAKSRRLRASVSIALGPKDLFVARVPMPPGHPGAHKKALALRLPELVPIDVDAIDVAARRSDAGTSDAAIYMIAVARTQRLEELETLARGRGARRVSFHPVGHTALRLETPRTRRRRRRGAVADALLVTLLVAAFVSASSAARMVITRETEGLVATERTIRQAAVARERDARDAEIAGEFVARGVLDRRAGSVVEDLAALNEATPDGAWWTRVRWEPDQVLIWGESDDASAAIEGLSAEATGWRVALSDAVRASGSDGRQSFELRVTRRSIGDD